MRSALSKAARRFLILGHRWLGIGTGALFALWIASGLVMLHVPFPGLREAARLSALPPLALDVVRVAPNAALDAVGPGAPPVVLDLEMRGDEPVYRLVRQDGVPITISAASGAVLSAASPEEAVRLADAPAGSAVETLVRDQWTVHGRYDSFRPLHRVSLADEAGTERYVSAATGAVVLATTRFERGWNWVGAVVHWVYLTPLRARPDLWRTVVLWLSGIAALNALAGLGLGVWRLRLRRRYRGGSMTPYRGLARWHHLAGLLGGIGLTGFIVSGWLSMNPYRVFSGTQPSPSLAAAYAGTPGPLGVAAAALPDLAAPKTGLRALRFRSVGGRWYVASLAPAELSVRAVDGGPGPDEADILAAAAHVLPDTPAPVLERLTAYDSYWYRDSEPRPLPILRLRFADAAATWLHVDPADGAILSRLDRSGRANRWLFAGLHRLDLPPIAGDPAARTALQWILNLLAAAIAVTGLVGGWRRLARTRRA